MFTYKEKTAIITGASSGLGLTFAHALAERSMNVILVARSEEHLRASEEYRKRGIRFLALCPGNTETNFFQVAGEGAAFGRQRASEQVIATALQALERGRTVVIDGQANIFNALAAHFLPQTFVARLTERSFRPRDTKTKTRVSVSL